MKHIRKENKLGKALALVLSICMVAGMLNFGALMSSAAENSAGGGSSSVETSSETPEGEELPSEESTPAEKTPEPQNNENPPDETDPPQETPSIEEETTPAPDGSGEVSDAVEEVTPAPEESEESEPESSEDEHPQDSEDLPPEVTPPPTQEEPEIEESTPAPDDSGEVSDAVEETTPSPEEEEPEAEPSETEQSQGTDVMPIAKEVAENTTTNRKYETLQAAIDEVQNEETIKLLTDVTENIVSNKRDVTYTLDLDNHYIDGGNTDNSANKIVFTIKSGTVTLQNGTIQNGYLITQNYSGTPCGAGLEIEGRSTEVTLSKMTFSNNTFAVKATKSKGAAAIGIDDGKLTVSDSVIQNNTAVSGSCGIFTRDGAQNYELTLTNTEIKNNTGRDGTALRVTCKISATDCVFSNNGVYEDSEAASQSKSSVIYLAGNQESTFENCKIQGNGISEENKPFQNIIHVFNSKSTMEGCLISGNGATATAGIRFEAGTLTLKNTVIKDNKTTADYSDLEHETDQDKLCPSGGVTIIGGSFTFESGAIYNNQCTELNTEEPQANDIYIPKGHSTSLIPANTMTDGEKDSEVDFTQYVWRKSDGTNYTPSTVAPSEDLKLTAYDATPRYVAELNDQETERYNTLAEAVNRAKVLSNSGQTPQKIKLIAEYKGSLEILAEEGVTLDFPVTIDFNGRSVIAGESADPLFTISNNQVRFEGKGEVRGNITVSNNATLELACSMPSMNVTFAGESSVLKWAQGFEIGETLNITLPQATMETLNKVNEGNTDITATLIMGGAGHNLSDKVKVMGATNPHLIVKDSGQDLAAVNPAVNESGYCVGGTNADDSNEGTYEKPLGTVEAAIKKLGGKDGTIYLLETINTAGSETWKAAPGQEITIKRFSPDADLKNKNMIDVKAGTTLTLENITLDGDVRTAGEDGEHTSVYTNAGSMIKVEQGGKLILNNGAELCNNDVSGSGSPNYYGGAVYSEGAVTMNKGSSVHDNFAVYGGGIALKGEDATMVMNGGVISGNRADSPKGSYGSLNPSGGGILLADYSSLEMKDGTIEKNHAHYGGGVSVGSAYITENDYDTSKGNTFTMTGGLIDQNESVDFGGGIYIQAAYKAEIHAGSITNNKANNGNYGGGGIYVNGGRGLQDTDAVVDGELRIYNVLIAENYAGSSGGGIAVCNTGSFTIYETDGSIIYDNHSGEGNREDDILSSVHAEQPMPNPNGHKDGAEDHIGFYMMDGTPYNWKRLDSGHQDEAADYAYLNSAGGKHIYTKSEPSIPINDAAIKTFITGNSAGRMGGGIGSNGRTFIGNDGGSLTVSKEVTGAAGDTEKIWHFDIHVDGVQGEHTGWLWDSETHKFIKGVTVNFSEDGNYTAELKHNQTLEITGLPQGAKYSVTEQEANKDGYETSSKVVPETLEEPDKIPEDSIVEVAFTNHKPGGGLTVSKTVTGTGDKEKKWNFTVELSDKSITGVFGEMEFKNGVAAFTLKDSESKTAEKLPAGITYEVTEKEADKDGYETSFTGNTGEIREDKVATASFVNSRSGNSTPPNWWWPPLTVWPSSTPGTPPTESPTPSPTPGISVEPTPGAPSTPPAPPSDSPPTGDESDAGFWALMAGVSLIGILSAGAGYFVSRRKRLGR